MSNMKPFVNKNRKTSILSFEIYPDFSRGEKTFKDQITKLFEDFRENIIDLGFDDKEFIGEPEITKDNNYDMPDEFYIEQGYYTESEEEWKERVKSEEEALRQWELKKAIEKEAKELKRIEDLQKQIEELEKKRDSLVRGK